MDGGAPTEMSYDNDAELITYVFRTRLYETIAESVFMFRTHVMRSMLFIVVRR